MKSRWPRPLSGLRRVRSDGVELGKVSMTIGMGRFPWKSIWYTPLVPVPTPTPPKPRHPSAQKRRPTGCSPSWPHHPQLLSFSQSCLGRNGNYRQHWLASVPGSPHLWSRMPDPCQRRSIQWNAGLFADNPGQQFGLVVASVSHTLWRGAAQARSGLRSQLLCGIQTDQCPGIAPADGPVPALRPVCPGTSGCGRPPGPPIGPSNRYGARIKYPV